MTDLSAIASGTQAAAANASNKLAGDFDAFLLLLTTQLKNQDPLSPLDTTEFTNQLVQFANVEQSIETNSQLETLNTLTALSRQNTSIGYIGTVVEAVGSEFYLEGEGDYQKFSYYIPEDTAKTTIQILDSTGEVIRTLDDPQAITGRHEITWDGKDDQGVPVDMTRKYQFRVSANAENGSAKDGVITGIYSTVSGIQFQNGESVLSFQGIYRNEDVIISIHDKDSFAKAAATDQAESDTESGTESGTETDSGTENAS